MELSTLINMAKMKLSPEGYVQHRIDDVKAIWLHECHRTIQVTSFADLADAGTPICPECGDDGELVSIFVKE